MPALRPPVNIFAPELELPRNEPLSAPVDVSMETPPVLGAEFERVMLLFVLLLPEVVAEKKRLDVPISDWATAVILPPVPMGLVAFTVSAPGKII